MDRERLSNETNLFFLEPTLKFPHFVRNKDLPQCETEMASVLDTIGYPWIEDDINLIDDDDMSVCIDYEQRLRRFALQSMTRHHKEKGTKIHVFMVHGCNYGNGIIHLLHHRPNKSDQDSVLLHHEDNVLIHFPNLCTSLQDEIKKLSFPFAIFETRGVVSYLTCQDLVCRLNDPLVDVM
jgi:hypothetical protein